MTLIKKSSL